MLILLYSQFSKTLENTILTRQVRPKEISIFVIRDLYALVTLR